MIKSITIEDMPRNIDLPSICPYCNQGGTPDVLASCFSKTKEYSSAPFTQGTVIIDTINLILKCTTCEHNFFTEYFYISKFNTWKNVGIFPHARPQLDLPEKIGEYFPNFYEIYKQASIAESQKLDYISGMAYRKAIEYLVKHYLIEILPDEKDAILKESLSVSIKRIEHPKIKVLATAATWLGNDQTHIIQKHEDYGVQDIKSFTIALCHLIISEKVADEALALIQK